ncbi:MAG: hypothetical protein ACRCSF_01530 [Mycobacteriaceae bacterium]
MDEIDWVLEHEYGPVARFIGVSEEGASQKWVYPLSGFIGCFDTPDGEALNERQPTLRSVDLVGGDSSRGIVSQYEITVKDLTCDHLGLFIGVLSDDGKFNVPAKIIQIHQIPNRATCPGAVVKVRIGETPSQPSRVDGGLYPPNQVFEIIELRQEGDPEYRHPRCYVNTHGGCSATISGEHYVSHGLIKLFTFDNPNAMIQHNHGAGIVKPVKPKKFVTNVLCTSHNQGLRPADDAAISFARFIRDNALEWRGGAGEWGDETEVHISGDDFQRWALKLLLNHAAAKAFTGNGGRVSTPIPSEAVDILLGRAEWPETWGISVASQMDSPLACAPFNNPESVLSDWWSAQPFLDNGTNTIRGGTVLLAGIEFGISLFNQGRELEVFNAPKNPIRGSIQRPSFMRWEFQGIGKTVHFLWEDGWEHKAITYTMLR